jgi:SAM-dependent methyltransferase
VRPQPPLTINGWLRYDLIAPLLDGLSDVRSVLEIGAGGGALGVRLAQRYRYVGLELDERSFETARARFERAGVERMIRGDLSLLADGEEFDLVCAFEVLEHCEDDAGALRDWRARVRENGWLLLSVPAFERQLGPWDRKAGHYRRYERDGLARTLAAAGFEAVSIEAFGFPLGNVLEALRDLVARRAESNGSAEERTAASGRLLQPPDGAGALTKAISAPGRLLQRPFRDSERGTGFVVLARRRD